MKPVDVVNMFGSQQLASDALGVSHQTVSHWVKMGTIPLRRQAKIEMLTKGELKANIHEILLAKLESELKEAKLES
jgi:DNA-binding transcriptional regulator YdaS (Cro superfamily)